MHYFKIAIGVLIALSASRFIPHPPNFTSLLALSFYVPALMGRQYIPVLIVSFAITDFIIGYHTGTHWTWGSVFLIGLISHLFANTLKLRVTGALVGACIFFTVTNFGVWVSGMYGHTLDGFIKCYTLALPFFTYSLISTLIFSFLIEVFYKLYLFKFSKLNLFNKIF